MTLNELKDKIKDLDVLLIDSSRLRTEYWRKITWSFSPLFFILLGFPIAVITHKREKSANVVLAILCVVVYYLVSLGCEALAINTSIEPMIVMWIPNSLAAITALILTIKCVS